MGFFRYAALGASLGAVGGLILWIFQSWMVPGMYDFVFPFLQGGLLGAFYWLFLSMGLFMNSKLGAKESE